MTEPTGVALFSRLKWPKESLGERALLVVESYDLSVWGLDASQDPVAGMRERGFEVLGPDDWVFPYLDDHVIAVDESSDGFELIDEAAEPIFGYPLSSIPQDWYGHLKTERNCLFITGVDLRLATTGMDGVKRACAVGKAFGAMFMINDGSFLTR